MHQPLERYGVVVLLFLVALVAVAIFWEDGSGKGAAEQQLAAVEAESERQQVPTPERVSDDERAPRREDVEMSREGEDDGPSDKRGRTSTYGAASRVPRGGDEVPAPERTDEDEGFSRPEARGGRADGAREDRMADELGGGEREVDPLVAELDRAAREAAREEESRQRAAVDATVTPAPAPQSKPAPAARTVVVKSGDSLWKIAQRELGSGNRWQEIASLNGLGDGGKITAGMQLTLPASAAKDSASTNPAGPAPATAPATTTKPTAQKPAAGAAETPKRRGTGDTTERLADTGAARRYVVRAGDTLGTIAQRELGSVDHVAAIQSLNGMRDSVVRTGTTLLLPAGSREPREEAVAAATPPAAGRAVPAGARRSAPASTTPRRESRVR